MDGMVAIGISGVVGLCLGFGIAKLLVKGDKPVAAAGNDPDVEWWKVRETLTGTQLQILQYLESKKSASITQLQEKFSFIPDRELYYRLEQIVLMQFVQRGRKEEEVMYNLNQDYSGTVEDDKTVMLSGD